MIKPNPITGILEFGTAKTPIRSPWAGDANPLTKDQIVGGNWIFLQSGIQRGVSFIDLIELAGLNQVKRLHLDHEGGVVKQRRLSLPEIRVSNAVATQEAERLIAAATPFSNDLQIANTLRLVYGKEISMNFMNRYAPKGSQDHVYQKFFRRIRKTEPCVHLVVIFNHNYARNIRKIESIYSDRFSNIGYVLPCFAPDHPSCLSSPAGSYQYHSFISHYLSTRKQQNPIRRDDVILFIQDDVLLNQRISEKNLHRELGMEGDSNVFSYYTNTSLRLDDPQNKWVWTGRIRSSLDNQKSADHGNGFEGNDYFFHPSMLKMGVGDIFAIKGCAVGNFQFILDHYISQNVFPECSIPTAIHATARLMKNGVHEMQGIYLWNEDRQKAKDPEFIEEFHSGPMFFLHPFKYSALEPASS